MKRFTIIALLLTTAQLGPAPGRAVAESICDSLAPSAARYEGGDPRVRELDIDGYRVVVLVPPGYDESTERYPVVYLMPGGGHTPDATYLINTDLIEFTADPTTPKAIIVMPDPWSIAALWLDWRSGDFREESFFTDVLVPRIDEEFRTRAGRAHRAIAGFSAGGFGALHLAARHPDLFAAAAGFDAVADVDETDPYYTALLVAISAGRPACEGGEPGPFGMLGDPVTDRVWWANASPASLAPNFGTLSLDVYVGNRMPCDEQDVADYVSYWFGTQSLFVYPSNARFHDALVRAGVAHSYLPKCGIHSYRHLQQQIHTWWGTMAAAFGAQPPASFDYRAADATFSVWDWTFVADPGRAPEFLDVADASCDGLGLTGSGTTTVTTASCFEAGETVLANGEAVTADDAGRITFTVDLGPAHEHQQYTPAARALGTAGGYWTSRTTIFQGEES
jgi:S-formylglutathione hydrolase FrmB